MSYVVVFTPLVEKVVKKWKKSNPSSYKKLLRIVLDIAEHPREGIGHPEPLFLCDDDLVIFREGCSHVSSFGDISKKCMFEHGVFLSIIFLLLSAAKLLLRPGVVIKPLLEDSSECEALGSSWACCLAAYCPPIEEQESHESRCCERASDYLCEVMTKTRTLDGGRIMLFSKNLIFLLD